MKKTLLLLLLVLPLTVTSQNIGKSEFYLIDSLDLDKLDPDEKELITKNLKAYHKTQNEVIKLNFLNHIVDESSDDIIWPKYNEILLSQSQKLLKTKLTRTERNKVLLRFADAYNNKGFIQNQNGFGKEAISYFSICLPIYIQLRNKKAESYCYNNMALAYNNIGNMILAMKYYFKAMENFESIKELEGMAITYNNIGSIFDQQKDYVNALLYYNKALKIQKKIGDQSGIATSYNNIGFVFNKTIHSQRALQYYFKAYQLYTKLDNLDGKSTTLSNIGSVYFEEGAFEKAIYYFNLALDIDIQNGNQNGIAYIYSSLGHIYLNKSDIPKAKKYALESLRIATEIGNPEVIKTAAQLLSKIYKKEKNWLNSYKYMELFYRMQDSILNSHVQKESLRLGLKYEFDKQKELDKKENEKKLAISSEREHKQRILIYFSLGILLVVISFLVIIFNRFRVIRRQKLIIENQKHEVEEKNKEILDSITYAKRIQSAILPQTKLVKQYLKDSFILYKPKDIIAGDFYWFEVRDNLIFFAAADCTGHGVPGAMISVVCHNALNRSVKEFELRNPGQILDKTREIVVAEFEKSDEDVKDGMDISLCILDQKLSKLWWAGAHNSVWIFRNGDCLEYKGDKQPIGKYAYSSPFSSHEIDLEINDEIYISTDGYQDQFGGAKGKKFKAAQMRSLFFSLSDKSMEEKKIIIDDTFEKWKGELEQVDDVCVIGVKI